MKATFETTEPIESLMDQLVDGLHLLYECRRRGVGNLDRLREYIEYTMDEIERRHLGMSSELFVTMLGDDESIEHIEEKQAVVPATVLPFEKFQPRN